MKRSTSSGTIQRPFVRRRSLAVQSMTAPELGAECPRPNPLGSIILVGAIAFCGSLVAAGIDNPERVAALFVGAGMAASFLVDYQWGGLRNLFRADSFGLLALYFLVFFEFLFPQEYGGFTIYPASVREATILSLWGFAGITIGRHIGNIKSSPFTELFTRPFPAHLLLIIFWLSVTIGYLHMLIAVQFNLFEMIEDITGPRFSQAWTRGRLGDWKALLIELGLFIYLIPPLAAIIIARREKFKKYQIYLVSLVLLFTIFQGFASGTRNILAAYLLTFLIGYAFACSRERRKELISLGVACAALLVISTVIMVDFRQIGLANYLKGYRDAGNEDEINMVVDYNLYSLSKVVEVFPEYYPYLGWEIPYNAIIRPIPRAIWKGKPEGLSVSIEDAVGAEGWTVSTTFVGEAYMAGGLQAVIIISLILGAAMGWWSHLASPRNSEFGMLVYASGFFAIAISMRSILAVAPAVLPTLGGLVLGKLLLEKAVKSRRAFNHVPEPVAPAQQNSVTRRHHQRRPFSRKA